jgi:hypothetical protein
MISRRVLRRLRSKTAVVIFVALVAVAALTLPNLAGAITAPSIDTPADGSVLGAGNRTITFSMPSSDGTETGYELLRASPNGGACDSSALGTATTQDSASGTAPLAPAPLVDSEGIPDGDYCYWVMAADAIAPASNVSSPIKITYDTTDPVVSITGGKPANPTSATGASFTFTADSGSVECKLDGGSFSSCSSPKAVSGLSEGSHTFTVRSTDAVGNVGSDSYTWTVDHTAPVVTITGGEPANPTQSTGASFTFTADSGSVECSVDGGSFTSCSSPKAVSGLSEGSHTFTVRSTDAVGNVGSDSYTWTVDHTAPVITLPTKPALFAQSTTADFTFSGIEGTPQCKLDGGSFGACTTSGTMHLTGLSEALHTFTVQSLDTAGNTGSASYSWTVDHTAPVVSITSEPASSTTAMTANFAFSGTEGTTECKLDSGSFGACVNSTTMSYSSLSDATHTFTVRSTDAAGNIGSDVYSWTIDSTKPTVPTSFALSGPTTRNSQPVFTFNASSDAHPMTYHLYRNGVLTTVVHPPPTITDTTMATDGTGDGTFDYSLTAIDSFGNESDPTANVRVTISAGPPSVPGGLRAVSTVTRSAPIISWNASTGSPAAYRVFRNGQQISTVNAPTTTFSDSLPLDGSADADYTYTVVAIDSLTNASAQSTPLHVVLDTTRPASAASLTAAASPTAAKPVLVWPASVSSDVAGYNVYRGTTKVNGALVTTTSFTDSALAGDGTYAYTVRSVDQAGNESADSTSASVLYDTTAPGTPGASAVAAATGGTASLSWAPVTDTGSGVVSYQVRRSPSGGAAPIGLAEGTPVCGVLTTSATGCGDAGLMPGGSYRYSVFAIDKVGNVSMPGETSTISVPSTLDKTPPKAPTTLHAVVSNGQIRLTWKNPKADFAAVSVILNAKRAPRSARDGSVVYHGSSAKATVKMPKLSAGKLVRFAVFAADKAGNTSPAARTTVLVPKPSPVSLAPNGKLSGDPNLTWNAITGATYYNVQVFEGIQASKRVGISWPTVTKWTLPGKYMKKGKVYTWYVWPGIGAKSAANYGKLIGKVTFTYTG